MRIPTVEVEIAGSFMELEPQREAWNRLVDRAQTSTIFQTYECHESWWKAYGSSSELLVLLARADGELLGIAPLMVSRTVAWRRTRCVVQFIGTRSFDYADFIIDRERPDILPLLLDKLFERERRVDMLYFRDIPDTSSTPGKLGQLLNSRGMQSDIRVLYEAPTRVFNNPAEDRMLPKKKSLKRHHGYFQKSGRVEFRNCLTAEEASGYLEAFFSQHIGRRAMSDTPSVFHDPRARTFVHELTHSLAPRGWLLFSVLLFDDKPIAMHLGFEYGKRIIWYKPTFDVAYADHSPGEVLLKYLLEYALERKVAEFDFTIGAEPYKSRYANHKRSNYAVRAFTQWREYHATRALLNARRLVERFPAANRVARKLLGRWREQPWL